jgi:hypothetical protein
MKTFISALGDFHIYDISTHNFEKTQSKSSACERVTFQRPDITSKLCETVFRHFLCIAVIFAFICKVYCLPFFLGFDTSLSPLLFTDIVGIVNT